MIVCGYMPSLAFLKSYNPIKKLRIKCKKDKFKRSLLIVENKCFLADDFDLIGLEKYFND